MRTFSKISRLCGVLLVLLYGFTSSAQVQTYGCKDPAALNYSAAATIDNGSCRYQKKSYTPPIRVDSVSAVLEETSGLQWAGNSLWSFNDGSGTATLFRIDTGGSDILQTVNLQGATNIDWEDIAFDGTYFYIGDFGNNANGARTDLRIYKFPLRIIPPAAGNATFNVPADSIQLIHFTYNDQPSPPVATGGNSTKFDCEAMVVDNGKIHLFSKNWVEKITTHYVISDTAAGAYVATAVENLATGYFVTAADKVPGTNTIVLLGYLTNSTGDHFLTYLAGFSGNSFFNGTTRLFHLPWAAEMGQAEGITFRNNGYGYISNEKLVVNFGLGTFTAKQRIRIFTTAAFQDEVALPLSLLQFNVVPASDGHDLRWRFSEPVVELRLEQSSDGLHFTPITTLRNSKEGSFSNQPTGGNRCYRLAWKTASNRDQYSPIVCASQTKGGLGGLRLFSDGGLQVMWQGSKPADYRFTLLATDGRTLGPTVYRRLAPGFNAIRLASLLSRHSVLLLQANGGHTIDSRLLMVE
jgi:hypothetical protein